MAQIWNRFRQLTFGSGKSAGRNSSGRITLFHRGGGAKRLQRRIDLKRSTTSMGIVERIEYDPNRSSRIALVRWKGGVHQKKCNSIEEEVTPPVTRLESTTATTIRGPFAFSSMPSCVKDVFSPVKTKAASSLSLGSSFPVPRMAVAGAMPPFFVCRKSEPLGGKNNTFSLGEIRKWSTGSSLWAHRIKRKAAVSWHSKKDLAGPVGASQHSKSRMKTKTIDQESKKKFGRVPVTYMIASHQLEAGKMVMNWSKPA